MLATGFKMDNFQIWDYALEEQEINDYINCFPTGNETGLIAYIDFNNEDINVSGDAPAQDENCQNYDDVNSNITIGDVNCDSLVNEVDAQAILEYTYTNGATPLPCDI